LTDSITWVGGKPERRPTLKLEISSAKKAGTRRAIIKKRRSAMPAPATKNKLKSILMS
jgi:hypothetical protein